MINLDQHRAPMKIFRSSNDIEKLKHLPIKERSALITKAENKLTAPEKLVLNLIKLLMLIPPFYFLAQKDGVAVFLSVLVSLVIYFFIYRNCFIKYIAKKM